MRKNIHDFFFERNDIWGSNMITQKKLNKRNRYNSGRFNLDGFWQKS